MPELKRQLAFDHKNPTGLCPIGQSKNREVSKSNDRTNRVVPAGHFSSGTGQNPTFKAM